MAADRKALLAIIHIAKNERGLSDDEYEAAVGSVAKGKSSAADLNLKELSELANALQGKREPVGRVTGKQQWLIRELWKQKSTQKNEAALNSWLEHHWEVSSLRFLGRQQASRIISVLKKW